VIILLLIFDTVMAPLAILVFLERNRKRILTGDAKFKAKWFVILSPIDLKI